MGATSEGTVVAAWEPSAPGAKPRAVVAMGDDRLTLVEGWLRREEGRALFPPQPLDEILRCAELVVTGNAQAISNPKMLLVLATGLIAVARTIAGEGD